MDKGVVKRGYLKDTDDPLWDLPVPHRMRVGINFLGWVEGSESYLQEVNDRKGANLLTSARDP